MEEAMEKVPGIFRRWENSTIDVTFWHKTGGGSMQMHGWRRIGRTKLLKRRTGDWHWSWRTQFYFAGNDIWVWCSLGLIQKEKERTSSQSKRFSKPLHKHIFSTWFRFRRVVSRHIEQERASSGLKSWLRLAFWEFVKFWPFGMLAFDGFSTTM